jgi:hypothetical protein
MALERDCPACGQRVMVPDLLAGKAFRCPVCGAVGATPGVADEGMPNDLPSPGAPPNGETAPEAAGKMPIEPETRPCPACFETIPANTEKCHFCGEDPRVPPRRPPLPTTVRRDCEPHRGNVILVLGIFSLVFLPCAYILVGIVLGAIAWVMGNRDIKKIRAGTMDPEGEGVTNAGRICGIVGVSTNAFVAILSCLYMGGIWAVMFYGMRASATQGPTPPIVKPAEGKPKENPQAKPDDKAPPAEKQENDKPNGDNQPPGSP